MKINKIVLFTVPVAFFIALATNNVEAYQSVVFKNAKAFDEACRWELRPRYGEDLVPSKEPFKGELTDEKIKRCEFLLEANRPEPEKKLISSIDPKSKSGVIRKSVTSNKEPQIKELLALIEQLQALIKLLQKTGVQK